MPQPEVEFVDSNFAVHSFVKEVGERKVAFQVVKMIDSLMVYINDKDQLVMTDLSFGMNTRFDPVPLGTRLLGNISEDASKLLSTKLAKKLNKTVFVSFNVQLDRFTLPLTEKVLMEEIKNHPECF